MSGEPGRQTVVTLLSHQRPKNVVCRCVLCVNRALEVSFGMAAGYDPTEYEYRTSARAVPRHGLGPRRHVRHGIRQALSRRATCAPGKRGRVLDGSVSGEQRALRAICRSDGIYDVRRAAAEPG